MAFVDAKDVSLVGHTIGNYKVVQQIGEGGMGVVYLAEHPVIGRKVAIKLLHATFARDSETVSRFFNEARAIHMIAHPNIVEILDFGQTADGQPYFIMEFLAGQPLADRISAGPVPPAEAVAIASQICDALQAAHDKNIVHRDLKPHNVYLVGPPAKPLVKILDFGVAKMTTGWNNADSGGHSVKTRTGSLMGTPLYMSPEQCRGSGKLDHRTDIYSLAVILYEMIAGVPPFTAEGVGELFAKHMLEPAPSLGTVAPSTPPHVVRAVARALAKDLEDRFATMTDFREALNGRPDVTGPRQRSLSQIATSSGNHPISATGRPSEEATTLSSAVSEMSEVSLARSRSRSRNGLMMSVVIAVVVAGGAILLLRPGKPDLPPAPAVSRMPPHPPEPSPSPPAAPETVVIRFEAEPEATHVFRKVNGKGEREDLGTVPIDLKLTKSDDSSTYLFHADGFKDRVVNLDASRDRVQHLDLDRLPAPEKKIVKAAPPRPARPVRRPVVHDGDGLAVPSF
jgi:eukaryotic-like serine/threonine-protein kinase